MRNKKIILAIGILLIVLLLVIYGLFSTNELPIQTNFVSENQKIKKTQINTIHTNPGYTVNLAFNLSDSDIPETLPVYRTSYEEINEQTAKSIAENLGFISEPIRPTIAVTPRYYMYSERGADLTIYPDLQVIDFKTGINSTPTFSAVLDEKKIQDVVTSFLVSRNFSSNTQDLYIYNINYVTLDPAGHFTEATKKDHNAAFVYVTRNIDLKYPLLSTSNEGLYNILINSRYEIVSIKILPNPKFESSTSIPLKRFSKIQSEIYQAKLTSIGDKKYEPFESFQLPITNIALNSMNIGYMNNPGIVESNTVYPFFIFEGTATFSDKTQEPVKMVLEAIPQEYFKE